jgi:hypothetical protein
VESDGTDNKRSMGAIVGIVGGVALVLGSLLTWGTGSLNVQALATAVGLDPATVSAVLGDVSRSVSGIDVTGGKWALAMGIVAIVLGVVAFLRVSPRVVGIGLIVAGLIGGGWALYDTTQADVVKEQAIEDVAPQLGSVEGASAVLGQYIDTSFGPGIWISILGGLVAIGGGIVLLTAGGSMTETTPRMGAATGSGFTPTEPPPASPPPASPPPASPPPASPPPAADPPATPAPMPPADPSPPPSEGGETSPSGGSSEPTP